MAHTKGPWKFDDNLGCKIIKGGKSGAHKQAQYTEIAATVGLHDEDTDRANARLMAASPDLLEACKQFVAKVECGRARSVKSYAQMKAAIAKAKGETE